MLNQDKFEQLCHYDYMPIQKYWKFTTKKWKFSDKNSNIFHISAQNIDCGHSLEPPRRGDSNEYPQSMLLSRNKKIMYSPITLALLYKSGVQGGQN